MRSNLTDQPSRRVDRSAMIEDELTDTAMTLQITLAPDEEATSRAGHCRRSRH